MYLLIKLRCLRSDWYFSRERLYFCKTLLQTPLFLDWKNTYIPAWGSLFVCLFFYYDWWLDLLGRRHWETFKPSNAFSSMHISLHIYRDKREKIASHIVFNSMRTSMKLSRTYNFPTNNSFIQFVRDVCSSILDDKRSQDDFQAEKGFHLNNKLLMLFLGKWPEIYSVIMTNRRQQNHTLSSSAPCISTGDKIQVIIHHFNCISHHVPALF